MSDACANPSYSKLTVVMILKDFHAVVGYFLGEVGVLAKHAQSFVGVTLKRFKASRYCGMRI